MLPGAVDNQTWISVTPQRPLLLEYFPPNKSEMSQNDCTLNVCKCRNSAHTNREHWNPYIENRNWILVPHHIQNSSQVDKMHKCKIWNRSSNRKKKPQGDDPWYRCGNEISGHDSESSKNKSHVTHDIVSSVAGEHFTPHTGEGYLAIVYQIKD